MKSENGFQPCTLAKLATLATQTLEAATLPDNSSPAGHPTRAEQATAPEVIPALAAGPQEEPERATLADDMADAPAWLEARLESAAILEHEAGETWHRFTRRELLALADLTERADLEADPDALAAFAFALRLAEIREHGERLDHYTRAAFCKICGPVWLFPGDESRVLGCPWCMNTANALPIPRPPVVCSECEHWRPDTVNPPGGLGSCTTEAPASKHPGALWPRGEITCGDWRPKSEEHPA